MSEWQSIQTVRPFDTVLLWDGRIRIGHVRHDGAALVLDGNVQLGDRLFYPTLWMPLPEPPNGTTL